MGVQPQPNIEDPFVGFSGLLPLMELSTNEQGELVLNRRAVDSTQVKNA